MAAGLLAVTIVIMLIWCATGGTHWGTAALMSVLSVGLGGAVTVLGAMKAQHKLSGAYWVEPLNIRRFHGFGAFGWLLLVMMLMTVFSLLPLPLWLLDILSPASASLYREAWDMANLDYGWGRLSASGGRTAFALWMLVGFFGIYWTAVRVSGTRKRMTRLSHLLAVMGCLFVAMMGLRFVGYPVLLGESGAQSVWHIGLPVNVNHLSGVMLMLSLLALGGMLVKRHHHTYVRRALWGFLYLIFGVAIIMLKSRGAILAWGLGHLFVIGLYFASVRQVKWKTGLAMLGGIGVILVSVFILSAQTVGEIVEEVDETEIVFSVSDEQSFNIDHHTPKVMSKTQLYADFWPMAQDWGRAGIGRSAFNDVYPVYQGFSFHKRFRHAENEFFETWLEYGWLGGLICLVLGLVGLFSFIRMCWQQHHESKLIIGYVAALLAISIQNFFDFGLRYWTVGFLFWLFCGLLESRRQRWKFGKPDQDTTSATRRCQIEYCAGMGIWAVALAASLFSAGMAVDGHTESGLQRLKASPELTECALNMTVRPGSPEVRKIMGFSHLDTASSLTGDTQTASLHQARRWLESAHRMAPRDGRTSLHLGKTCVVLGDLDCAAVQLQHAVENTPKLRDLAMYEMAGLPEERLVFPKESVLRESLIHALIERQRYDIAFQSVSSLQGESEFAVEHAKLMCMVYGAVGFEEGCDVVVENLGDLQITMDYLTLKADYLIRHQDWENLFNLYESTEVSLQKMRQYWRMRLYHSVFYGKHRDSAWYHDAVPMFFVRYRQISNGDRQWHFDDAYCGAYYALEMQQNSRAIRDAKTALSIRPHHKGAQRILKEAENRQKKQPNNPKTTQ